MWGNRRIFAPSNKNKYNSKTTKDMESIITAATVLTMYMNAVNGNEVNYLYNADMNDGVVNRIEVYGQKDDHRMVQKMEYRYAYDEQGRLVNKEMLRWDDATRSWTEDSRLCYKYYENGYNVEVSHWNAAKQAYDLPSEVTLYRSMAPNLTSVKTYRMNKTQDNMFLLSRMLVMEPIDSHLLADR